MSSFPEEFIAGADYMHALAGACQRFIGAIMVPEPGQFVRAVRDLLEGTPASDTHAQLMVMWSTVSAVATRGAVAHHGLFHRCFGGACAFHGPWLSANINVCRDDVCREVVGWAESFTHDFETTHQWPPAVKAAALMRQTPSGVWHACDLARAAGASSSTLERGFKTVYGVTPQHYHILVRLQHTAQVMRHDSACIESVALCTGWGSVGEARRSFRCLTGLVLSAVRAMSKDDFESLLDGPLALPVPLPINAPIRTLDSDARPRRPERSGGIAPVKA